jgi:hypothetical protein
LTHDTRTFAKNKKPADVYQQLEGLIRPNQSIVLLQHLHILTQDGRINQDTRRKLKQVMHLAQFIERLIPAPKTAGSAADASSMNSMLTLVDLGAGKSYLGFILYDLFLKHRDDAKVVAVEMRKELVAQSQALQKQLGFHRFEILQATVQEAINHTKVPKSIDIVTALHACDTATDDAIRFALAKSAQHIVLVPCCQAQIARLLHKVKATRSKSSTLTELWRRPLHAREFGSHLTNVLRCLYLESCGYKVSVTELVGWEHSLKNELIIASRCTQSNLEAKNRLKTLLLDTGLMPVLGEQFGFALTI